jgi:N-acyl-L-homoserine lactone synthetase
MQNFRCIIARTANEIMEAQRLRWKVYGEEEALLPASVCVDGREMDARDDCEGTTHIIAYAGQEPAGTVRLVEPSPELDLAATFDLGTLSMPGIVPAEVTRFCVLRRYRCTGATLALFSALHAESVRRGITHWVADANMETDCAEDATLAWHVAREKKLVHEHVRAERRTREVHATPRRRPYYTEEQRARALAGDLTGLALPRTLALFASRMGARFIGSPVFDAYFNVFALPLVAEIAPTAKRAPHPADLPR